MIFKSALKLCASRDFFIVFFIALLFLVTTGAAHFYTVANSEKVKRELSENLNVSLGQSSINSSLNGIVSDLM